MTQTDKLDKIDTWIENRFGTKNTFNRQLLDNFIEFLEKELGYVRKDPDQGLPPNPYGARTNQEVYQRAIEDFKENGNWVKVKEKSNGEG